MQKDVPPTTPSAQRVLDSIGQSSLNAGAQKPFDLQALQDFYREFNARSLSNIEVFYHPSAIFIDPIHRLQGLTNIKAYFESFCSADMQCRFEFLSDLVTLDDNGSGSAFMQWRMHYSHRQFAGGKTLMLEGASFLKFDSKISFHQDYYDMGAMIYQHIPVLGWLIKKINHRLARIEP